MIPDNYTFVAVAAVLVAAAVIYATRKDEHDEPALAPGNPMDPKNVEIGPVWGDRNYSRGMPLHPTVHPEGWQCQVGPDQQPHYFTWELPPLTGKTGVTLRGRLELPPGVELEPLDKDMPYDSPAWISLYLQGPDLNTDRWWAATGELKAGTFELYAPLDRSHWRPVDLKADFRQVLEHTRFGGFTLGGPNGLGHGVRATGPARLIITSYEVE